jgi:thiol-disulfide isomerase/thioredoxin
MSSVKPYPSRFGTTPPGPCVLFCKADWCGFCTKAKPEIAEAARRMGSVVPVYVIDADKQEKIVSGLGVRGFPTIFYVDQNGRKQEYDGDRTGRAISEWVCNKVGSCMR